MTGFDKVLETIVANALSYVILSVMALILWVALSVKGEMLVMGVNNAGMLEKIQNNTGRLDTQTENNAITNKRLERLETRIDIYFMNYSTKSQK